MDHWYRDFFGEHYYQASFAAMPPERTEKEVSFIGRALDLPPGSKVLDLCCGPGRHTVALAKEGYRMFGLDLSSRYISLAQKQAQKAKVEIEFQVGDMRQIPFLSKFDAVINIFTSFGYFQDEEDNLQVVRSVSKKLKTGGKFLLDVANRDYYLSTRSASRWAEREKLYVLQENEFDPTTSRTKDRWIFLYKNGKKKEIQISIRLYALHEVIGMFNMAGLQVENVWGGFDGEQFAPTSPRLIAIGVKA